MHVVPRKEKTQTAGRSYHGSQQMRQMTISVANILKGYGENPQNHSHMVWMQCNELFPDGLTNIWTILKERGGSLFGPTPRVSFGWEW